MEHRLRADGRPSLTVEGDDRRDHSRERPPDLEGKLTRAAGRRGVSAAVLIREAIERAVDYDDWFVREVEKGLAQIEAGQVLTHDAVSARQEQKLAEHPSRR